MRTKYSVAFFVFILVAAAAPAGASRVERQLVQIKAALMSADYRADLPALAALGNRAAQLSGDRDLGYLADYWNGFASWRIVVNGANAKMPAEEAKGHLSDAVSAFESSIRKKGDFADAYSAEAAVHGWLAVYNLSDQAVMNRHVEAFRSLIQRALELEPSNPRALWIEAVPFAVLPKERGGDIGKAIDLYQRMLENSGRLEPDSPLPDWGRVEALMSLANANLVKPSPDVDRAAEEASAALRLEPDWHYVRDVLMPKIDARRKEAQGKE